MWGSAVDTRLYIRYFFHSIHSDDFNLLSFTHLSSRAERLVGTGLRTARVQRLGMAYGIGSQTIKQIPVALIVPQRSLVQREEGGEQLDAQEDRQGGHGGTTGLRARDQRGRGRRV